MKLVTTLAVIVTLSACKSRNTPSSDLSSTLVVHPSKSTHYVSLQSKVNDLRCIGIKVSSNTLIANRDCLLRLRSPMLAGHDIKSVVRLINDPDVPVSNETHSNFGVLVFAPNSFDLETNRLTNDDRSHLFFLGDKQLMTSIAKKDIQKDLSGTYFIRYKQHTNFPPEGTVLIDSFGSFLGLLMAYYPSEDNTFVEAVFSPWSKTPADKLLIEKSKKAGAAFEYFTSPE